MSFNLEEKPVYKIEENPFNNLFFDITYRCNLNCNICYNAKRMKRKNAQGVGDMSVEYFREVFRRLPKRKKRYTIRMVGGEPTLHPHLNELIGIVNEYGHNVTIATNGVRLADDEYIKEVETWRNPEVAATNKIYRNGDYPFIPFFDLSGGTKNNDLYQKIHGRNFLDIRMKAFENCLGIGMNTLGICAIIIRGVNEEVIPQLIKMAEDNPEIPAIHFRTMIKFGKWIDTEPYTLQELRDLVKSYIPDFDNKPQIKGFIPTDGNKCFDCCHRIVYAPGIGINIVEFGTERASKCWLRGFVSDDDFTITSYFNRIRNEAIF